MQARTVIINLWNHRFYAMLTCNVKPRFFNRDNPSDICPKLWLICSSRVVGAFVDVRDCKWSPLEIFDIIIKSFDVLFYLVDMDENEDEGCELVTGSDLVEVDVGVFFVLSFSSFIFGPNHFWCIWPQNDFIDFIWPKVFIKNVLSQLD